MKRIYKFNDKECYIKQHIYASGRQALFLHDLATNNFVASLTVDLPEKKVYKDVIFLKNHTEFIGFYDKLINENVIEVYSKTFLIGLKKHLQVKIKQCILCTGDEDNTNLCLTHANIVKENSKIKLNVTLTNFGKFYKAWFNGNRIEREELYLLIDYNDKEAGYSLETCIDEYLSNNPGIERNINEIDIT